MWIVIKWTMDIDGRCICRLRRTDVCVIYSAFSCWYDNVIKKLFLWSNAWRRRLTTAHIFVDGHFFYDHWPLSVSGATKNIRIKFPSELWHPVSWILSNRDTKTRQSFRRIQMAGFFIHFIKITNGPGFFLWKSECENLQFVKCRMIWPPTQHNCALFSMFISVYFYLFHFVVWF